MHSLKLFEVLSLTCFRPGVNCDDFYNTITEFTFDLHLFHTSRVSLLCKLRHLGKLVFPSTWQMFSQIFTLFQLCFGLHQLQRKNIWLLSCFMRHLLAANFVCLLCCAGLSALFWFASWHMKRAVSKTIKLCAVKPQHWAERLSVWLRGTAVRWSFSKGSPILKVSNRPTISRIKGKVNPKIKNTSFHSYLLFIYLL